MMAFTLVFVSALSFAAGNPAKITAFTPSGTAKNVRQVRATFSEAMVPFGDPKDLAMPFEMKCPVEGSARWADSKNWIYDYKENLEAGSKCEFKLKSGLKALSGNPVEVAAFAFDTGGPAALRVTPNYGDIHEEQAFIVQTDGPVEESSIEKNAYLLLPGVQNPIGVRLITGKMREEILKTSWEYRRFFLIKNRRAHLIEATETEKANDEKIPYVYVVQSRQTLPNLSNVEFIWGKGITGKSGAATTENQTFNYRVRPPFTATFSCERTQPDSPCIPVSNLYLNFSTSIPLGDAKQVRLKSKSKEWKPKLPTGTAHEESNEDSDAQDSYGVTFEGPFPENETFQVILPRGLKDDTGRSLSNASSFPLEVKTGEAPPIAKFAAEFGVLEKNADPALPLSIRNLDSDLKSTIQPVGGKMVHLDKSKMNSIIDWMNATREKWGEHRAEPYLETLSEAPETFSIPQTNGGKKLELVGIPLKKPGFYVVEVKSPKLGQALLGTGAPMYVASSALVTNLSVHLKVGRENSLVWVTALDTGKSVPGANVQIRTCRGDTIATATTDAQGLVRFPKNFHNQKEAHCKEKGRFNYGLWATAEKDDDFSFVHTSWDNGIEGWRFQLPSEYAPGPNIAHTVLDRSLLRAGETVHMKHIIRRHAMNGFTQVPGRIRPKTLRIRHSGTGEKWEFPLKWDATGIAENDWEIPKTAKLGNYEIFLSLEKPAAKKSEEPTVNEEGEEEYERDPAQASLKSDLFADGYGTRLWLSGSFHVEEFRVPLMKAEIRSPSETLISPKKIPLDLSVEYLAGGGAGGLPVSLSYQLNPDRSVEFEGFEGYEFGKGPIPKKFTQDEEEKKTAPVSQEKLELDKTGGMRTLAGSFDKVETPSNLLTELTFRDPNGEIGTVSRTIPVWPAASVIGVKPDDWFQNLKNFKIYSAVVDTAGKPLAGASVEIEYYKKKTYSHRKRLIGGFYAYEHKSQMQKLSGGCSGNTDSHGLLICNKPPASSGEIYVQAKTKDASGNTSVTHKSMWVYDNEAWWFAAQDNDRIDVLPSKKQYEAGETAELQVRMPFKEAEALVTVEREGIIEATTQHLSSTEPIVRVPIKNNFGPNVFVSVFVVRGRTGEVQPTALVDMGRPAFKMGIAQLKVGWKPYSFVVKVRPEREVYKVREIARVNIEVKRPDGGNPPLGTEVAIAAVDEGLLELMPNRSWNLLEAMMNPRGLEVRTSTVQMQVVGKRHFGLKAVPSGGGGGKDNARELFETLLYWKARAKLDAQGRANVEIPLNDSVTSFQIVAVANATIGRFGTGKSKIRSTQELVFFSGISPVIRQGDRMPASFTVRNSSENPLEVDVRLKTQPSVGSTDPKHLTLAPGASQVVNWQMEAPKGINSITYEAEANVVGKDIGDKIRVKQKVVEVHPVRTYQATISQLRGKQTETVQMPKDAIRGRGGIDAVFQPTLLAGLEGVKEYMQNYGYTCFEQQLSRAVSLRDRALWDRTMKSLPAHLDGNGLVKFFPLMDWGYDMLTAYVLSLSHESGWPLPEIYEERMLDGLQHFVEGKFERSTPYPAADWAIRKMMDIDALSRYERARASMLDSMEITPNLWPTSGVIDYAGVLERVKEIPEREKKLAEVWQILNSRLNFQGTVMSFSTERADNLWWLMTNSDVNANRLILLTLEREGKLATSQDMPRLVRGALSRLKKGHWDITTANAWGMLAMEKFSQTYEKDPVQGKSIAQLEQNSQTLDWANFTIKEDRAPAAEEGTGLHRSTAFQERFSFPWPEKAATFSAEHRGKGAPWLMLQSKAAIPLKEPLSSGYQIKKTVTPIEQKDKSKWTRGDLVRVRLDLDAQTDMTWVVVDDPVPAGVTILGSGLGRDSKLATRTEKKDGGLPSTFEERSFEAFRAYYEFVPKGKWSVEYTMRLNQSGQMSLPATRVEAMYSPELFGEIPNESREIVD